MSPSCDRTGSETIRQVLAEFLQDRRGRLSDEDYRLYRHVLFFLELCINNYGHRNLDEKERARYEALYSGAEGAGRHFFEIFGPERLLPEMGFFTAAYLKKEVHTSDRVTGRAPEVMESLKAWLQQSGKLAASTVAEEERRARERSRMKALLRKIERALSKRVVSVEASTLAEDDHVPLDDHPIIRLSPGRIWLSVYKGPTAAEIGPIDAPLEVTRRLKVGWNLCCALGRTKGRWRIIDLQEVYPRG